MRVREIILSYFMYCFAAQSAQAQNKLHFTFKAAPTLSWLGVNRKSDQYDKNLDGVNLTFKKKRGFAVGCGSEYDLSDNLIIYADIRYQQWGGFLKAMRDDPQFFVDLDINYKSFNIPFGLKYSFLQRQRTKFFLGLGMGIDRTFKVSFRPTNFYGTGRIMTSNANITTTYLSFACGSEFRLSSALNGIISLEVNNDMLLNPHRIQDMGGYFSNTIPLNYNLIALVIGLKI